ncbi:MAG: IS110 family transposase [bacterium]
MENQVTASSSLVSIGIDVDKQKSVVVALEVMTGQILYEGGVVHDRDSWQRVLRRLTGYRLWACYEAGCTGFGLCRMLRELGVDCRVVAPSAVPKEPERRQRKNDRLDATTLALMVVHPPRVFVRVPTPLEEDDRQLIRTREQLVRQRVRVINQVKAKLLFHGLSLDVAARSGTTVWAQAVRPLLPEGSSLCTAVEALLEQLVSLNTLIGRLERALRKLGKEDRYAQANVRLQRIPGVGPLTAMAFLTEVYRPGDFTTPQQLVSHLGLVPTEWSSGGTVRHGHLTHWGPPHLRRLLVEAAWVWVYRDPDAKRLYLDLCRGRLRKKAIVAMARRLATAMWAMTVKGEEYRFHWKQAA